MGMESDNGKESIRFELQISNCDVLNILKLIKECVNSTNEEAEDNKMIENDINGDSKDESDDPLDKAKKLGFTYLYPTKSRKSFL